MKVHVTGKLQYRTTDGSRTARLARKAARELEATVRSQFAPIEHYVDDVAVRITDENGPRGGVDVRCVMRIELSALPSQLVVVEFGPSVEHAVRAAADVARRAALRQVGRRRSPTRVPREQVLATA